jgi:hypothetical protein
MIEREMYREEEEKKTACANYFCKSCTFYCATEYAIRAHINMLHPCKPAEESIE